MKSFAGNILKRLLASSRRGMILTGHGVAKRYKSRFVEEVHIPFADFAGVIELLVQLDFDFLNMDQVIALSKQGFRHRKHWVHLTFDDGYQNIYEIVRPYLSERGIGYSIFVSTHHVETQDRFPTFYIRFAHEIGKDLTQVFTDPGNSNPTAAEETLKYASSAEHEGYLTKLISLFSPRELLQISSYENEKPLDVDSLKALANEPMVHIGSHMHHHWIFHSAQIAVEMQRDLERSLTLLQRNWMVSKNPTFCYPNGDYTLEAAKLCIQLKIPLSFVSKSGFVEESTHPQFMPRFALSNPRRTLLLCLLMILGNKSLYLFGRKAPIEAI